MNTPLTHLSQDIHDRPNPNGMPIHEHWHDAAEDKGFEITCRVDDRYHLMLRCDACGNEHRSKLYVVMQSQPQCPHCVEARWRDDAQAAGLIWLERDPEDRHYGYYEAPCGHELWRQFGLVKRIAAGACDHRCEICQQEKEQAEAEAQGWALIGPSYVQGPNYRIYRHGCGHEQSIARINMRSGRFNCACCGEGWTTATSYIYCMRFALPGRPPFVKLGFSRNPDSRLSYQLKRSPEICGEILRAVRIQKGAEAQSIEKRMHAILKRAHPEAIIPPEQYRDHLRVKSEIYAATLESRILQMLSDVEAGSFFPD